MRNQREHHSTCLAIPDNLNTLVSSGYKLRFTILCILILAGRYLGFLRTTPYTLVGLKTRTRNIRGLITASHSCQPLLTNFPHAFFKSNCPSEGKVVPHPCCEVEKIDLSRIFGTRWIRQDVDKLSKSMLISRRLKIRTG